MYPGTLSVQELPKHLIINLVKIEVCSLYKITMKDIRSKNRQRIYVEPRHIICYLLKKLLKDNITLVAIGEEINKPHDVVLASINKIKAWIETNKEFKEKINSLELKISCSV